jgi:hypothetical protein
LRRQLAQLAQIMCLREWHIVPHKKCSQSFLHCPLAVEDRRLQGRAALPPDRFRRSGDRWTLFAARIRCPPAAADQAA